MPVQREPSQEGETAAPIVVRKYGLLPPLDWDEDCMDELRRTNRFWNQLVEIERNNRAQYHTLVHQSEALREIAQQITVLDIEREAVIAERNQKRAAVRSKTKADTDTQEARLQAIREELSPLYAERKKLMPQARKQMEEALSKLEEERKAAVKTARQNSGLFWSNYNAVAASYQTARSKAMKEGAQLRFHRFEGVGRFVNQIQGGLSVEDLCAGKHSQVQLQLNGTHPGKKEKGILRIKAFVERDENNKPKPRYLHFPIVMERPIPPGSEIKMVTVNIEKVAGKPRYSVTFTCRAENPGEQPSGTRAAGVNIGWKQVEGGLRVATVAYSNGDIGHLLLPTRWRERMERVRTLQSQLDEGVNALLPRIKEALEDMPLWRNEESVAVEGYPEWLHRRLSGLVRAPKYGAKSLLALLWDLRMQWELEPNTLPLLHELAEDMEKWRKTHKRKWLELENLRDKLLTQRKHIYREFASQIADRAGLVAMDATSYKDAAKVKPVDGSDPELHAQARKQRVEVAPYELRLAITQIIEKRGGHVEKRKERINCCPTCQKPSPRDELVIACDCGTIYDTDEGAARNLLALALPEDFER